MGHRYIKEEDTFSTSQNGTVPKPTAQEVTDNKYLRADGTWKNPPGGGGGASEFADLDDVSFSNLQNGQIPKYNSTTQKWENANESGGGGTVTDVEVDGVSVVNQQGVAEITTPNADGISYDNQTSGLTATDVQSAIDEIAQGGGGNVDDVEVNGVSVVNASKVAEITSYKEITQSAYDLLPSSKLTDNVMYCIKDGTSRPYYVYSTTEQVVGTWIDGESVYEITVESTTTRDGSVSRTQSVSTGASNIKELIDLRGAVSYGSNTSWLPFTFSDNASSSMTNSRVKIIAVGNDGNVFFEIGNNYNGANCINKVIITIRYTKTTD